MISFIRQFASNVKVESLPLRGGELTMNKYANRQSVMLYPVFQ